jgi:outer membrane protein
MWGSANMPLTKASFSSRLLAGIGAVVAAIVPAHADTLSDTLAYAYAYNTQLAAARAHLRGVDEQVPQALAGWRPTVTVNGSGGYQTFNTGTSRLLPYEFGYQQKSYGGNVQIKQPLYSGGGTVADVARAEETVRAGRADLIGTEQTVLQAAATAFEDVSRARALLALDREIEMLLRYKLNEITLRMQAGQLTQTDIDQTSNRVAGASAARIGAEGDLLAANARFLAAVGRNVGGELTAHEPPAGLPKDEADAMRMAEANSPTVIASLFRMNAAQHAIIVARAALLPSISLSAMAGADQGQSFPTVGTKQASLTVNLAVPIYQGGALSSQLRQAQEMATESEIVTQTSRRDARRDAASAFAIWRASSEKLLQVIQQVRLGESAYDGVRKEAAVGAKSTFELLSQLQELFNARASEVQARYDAATDTYQLLVAIGHFTGADLRLQTPLYDATAHYDQVRNKIWSIP